MKSSIRHFLIVTLLASTIVLWLITLLADAAMNHQDIRNSLDDQLVYTSELIEALTQSKPNSALQNDVNEIHFMHFQFQLFDSKQQLVLRSEYAPLTEYSPAENGFF